MKTLSRLPLFILICVALSLGVQAQDVPLKEAGTYKIGSDVWKILVIPPGVSIERLIKLAQVLHQSEPNIRFHLFDNGSKVQQLILNKIHYPNSNYPFPEKWFNQHLVGSIQTMAFDRSGQQWVLLNQYQTQLASLEPEPITPKQIRPTATSRKDAAPGQVIIEYDPTKDLTTVSLKIMQLQKTSTSELHFSAMFAYSGRTPPKQDPFTLQILSIANEWKFADGVELTLLVDGFLMPLGKLKRDFADISNGAALESVSRGLAYRMFMKIAGAKRVMGRIGDRDFELLPDQISSLIDLASRMQQ
jgi:hypothetical protein